MNPSYVGRLSAKSRSQAEEAGQIILLTQRNTFRPQNRVPRDQVKEEVGQAMVQNSVLDRNLVSVSKRRPVMNIVSVKALRSEGTGGQHMDHSQVNDGLVPAGSLGLVGALQQLQRLLDLLAEPRDRLLFGIEWCDGIASQPSEVDLGEPGRVLDLEAQGKLILHEAGIEEGCVNVDALFLCVCLCFGEDVVVGCQALDEGGHDQVVGCRAGHGDW